MRKWWVLFFVLETGFCAEMLVPGFSGRSGSTLLEGLPVLESSPARKMMGVQLEVSGEIPAQGVDFQKFRLSGVWGNEIFRMGSFFEIARMDSIYRSVAGSWEAGFTYHRLLLGAGYFYQVEWVPGFSSWNNSQSKAAASVELPADFSAGILCLYPAWEKISFLLGFHWKISGVYRIFTEFWDDEFHIGHEILIGSIRVQSAYRYPGPQLTFEIGFHIGDSFAGAGIRQTASSLSAYQLRVDWKKESR